MPATDFEGTDRPCINPGDNGYDYQSRGWFFMIGMDDPDYRILLEILRLSENFLYQAMN